MTRISRQATNAFCPQTQFLYGTCKEDRTSDFGLFCRFSYCRDGEADVITCIGGEKLTKDRIKAGILGFSYKRQFRGTNAPESPI